MRTFDEDAGITLWSVVHAGRLVEISGSSHPAVHPKLPAHRKRSSALKDAANRSHLASNACFCNPAELFFGRVKKPEWNPIKGTAGVQTKIISLAACM